MSAPIDDDIIISHVGCANSFIVCTPLPIKYWAVSVAHPT